MLCWKFFDPILHIVNVNKDHYVSLTEEIEKSKQSFKEMFKAFKTEFYFITMNALWRLSIILLKTTILMYW